VLAGWLAEHCGLTPPVVVVPISGGRSNLTSLVTDARGVRVVVRRPPLSGVLASAHDVVREGAIMTALAPTAVPVPEVLGSERDAARIGAPFLVMAHVEGTVVRDGTAARTLTRTQRHALGLASARTLATIHTVDVDAVGLGALARREGYLVRQLARWARQLEQSTDRPLPMLDELVRRLGAALPEQAGVALVHGDFRLDNLIVDASSASVLAVLDWELATLGDPLADLATLLAYWGVPAGAEGHPAAVLLPGLPTAATGFPGPAELVAAYAEARRQDPDALSERLRPYLAFAWFRIACILEGVRSRTSAGAYGDADSPGGATPDEQELLHDLVPTLGTRALGILSRSGPLGFDHEFT